MVGSSGRYLYFQKFFLLAVCWVKYSIVNGIGLKRVGHSGGLAPPVFAMHSQGFASPLFSPTSLSPQCAGLVPWWPHTHALSVAVEGAFLVFPTPSCAFPCSSPAILSYMPYAIAVRVSFPYYVPPMSVASASVTDPSESPVLSPLHSSLTLLLPSWPFFFAQFYPPSPSMLT